MNMTQNIDDLEVKAGLPLDKVIQAHGHTREAHCTECKKEQDILKWKELADKEEPMFCSSCEKGIVKPDIIFFGEQLPERFFSAPKLVGEADLVFVIGTSLRVAPRGCDPRSRLQALPGRRYSGDDKRPDEPPGMALIVHFISFTYCYASTAYNHSLRYSFSLCSMSYS
jgi:hypothetical protein